MVLDYKDVRFSFATRRARRRRRLLRLALLALLLLAGVGALLQLGDSRHIRRASDLLLGNRLADAGRELDAAESWPFHRPVKAELRALLDLAAGRLPQARERLRRLPAPGAAAGLPRAALLRFFADRAGYRELLLYSEFLLPGGTDEALFQAAQARSALYRPQQSEECLARLSPAFQREQVKAVLLLRQLNRSLARGRFAFVFDRRGTPLAEFDVAARRSRSLLPGIDFSAFDAAMADGVRFFTLTLDAAVQSTLEPLFRVFPGTFVLLDLEDNGILAAYSRPRAGQPANAAFVDEYEPGSIIKLVTQLAFQRAGHPDFFPFRCSGNMTVAGRLFYDWVPHGTLASADEAMAVSCNLVFARMALQTGYDPLAEALRLFGFGAAPWRDRFVEFRCGRFRRPADEYGLVRLAVGLDEITVTTVQAALMAALIARDGEFSPPYLIGSEKTTLQLGCYTHAAGGRRQLLKDDIHFLDLQREMRAVIASDEGTGRRARLDSPAAAAKTGTSGNKAGGLDAILIGFFPYSRPRYAFAFRLEGGGRAELNGALLLRDFLSRLNMP